MSGIEWERGPQGSYVPPEAPGRDINIDFNTLLGRMDDLVAANERIASSIGGPRAGTQQARRDIRRRNTFVADMRYRGMGEEEQAAASEQELVRMRSEDLQRQIILNRSRGTIEAAQQTLTFGTPQDRLKLAERYGAFQGSGQNAQIAGYKLQQVQTAFDRSYLGEGVTSEDENILNDVNEQILSNMQKTIVREAPKSVERILDAVEESGIKQLRYGQIPLQDLLRSAGILGGRFYERTYTRALDARDRVQRQRDLGIEPDPHDVRLAGRGEEFARTGRARALGPLAGMGAGVARVLPVAGQFLSVGQIAAGIVQNQFISRYQNANRLGQVTGEGFGAGVGAMFQSFRIGANPFDMISQEVARQIVAGVRGSGFHGRQANSLAAAVSGTLNDLGTSVESTIQLYTDAIRQSGFTIDEARQRFEKFDDAAHSLNISVQEYTDQYLALSRSLRDTGAGRAAPDISQALIAATPRGVDPGIWGQLFQRARGEIAAGLGVPQALVGAQRYAAAAYGPGLQSALERVINQAKMIAGDDPNMIASYLAQQPGGYFSGMSVNDIQRVITQIRTGRGPSRQIGITQASLAYGRGYRGIEERTRVERSAGELYGELRVGRVGGRRGPLGLITPEARRDFRQRFGVTDQQLDQIIADAKGTQAGRTFQVYRERQDLPLDQLRQLRQQTFQQVRNLLSPEDRRRFREHLGDRNFDVVAELRAIQAKKGPEVTLANNFGNVTIGLKPGVERRLFELSQEREQQIARGNLAPNTVPPLRSLFPQP